MIRIAGRLATYAEIWFDEELPSRPGADVLLIRQRSGPIGRQPCSPSLTLVNDLSLEADAIMKAFSRTNRYEIRRAELNGELQAAFYTDPRAHLARFYAFYDEFARQKKLPLAYRRRLDAAANAGQLVLSCASRRDQALVWHAYITHGGKGALFHSASHFRTALNGDAAHIARANRWLHWRDMLNFKQHGLREYDWGGLFENESDPNHAGINRFKREFGGRPQRTYNGDVPVTIKGRAYLVMRATLDTFTTD